MTEAIEYPEGGFAYLPGADFVFSLGVRALPGHHLVRVRFRHQPPLAQGFALARRWLDRAGVPPAALAGVELRAPLPLSFAEFRSFNQRYVEHLKANGFMADGQYRIARSNLAPVLARPAEPVLAAFTFSDDDALPAGIETPPSPDFVLSGQPELVGAPVSIVAANDVSHDGMRQKARAVLDVLKERVERLGGSWSAITGTQIYTVQALGPVLDILDGENLIPSGLTLYPAYPPVLGLEFEIDVRAVSVELVI